MKKGLKKAIVSSLIAVFVLSLIAGLTPLDLVQPVSAASTKKAPIRIDNTGGGALSYYQVNLNITYDSDMNNDFSDLRVKNETAGAFVPYWIEDKSDGAWCNLWFNATSIPASGWCNDTYYLYYGDAAASSDSNITTTFIVSDDFEEEENIEADYFASNAVSQPFNHIDSPAAIYYNGRTYIVWQGGDNTCDPYITYYDHSTATWGDIVKVGDNPLTNDDHGAPAIYIDMGGYIHIFYGAHNLGQIKHAKSDNSENISTWSGQSDISCTSCTYPHPIKDGNSCYLIYRSTYAEWHYRKSTDNGTTWGSVTQIVDGPFYLGHMKLHNDKIHIAGSWLNISGDNGRYNYYHFYLNISNENMYSMDGTDLGANVTLSEANTHCKIDDSGSNGTNHGALQVDSSGYPYVIYPRNNSNGSNFYFAKWGGSSWSTPVNITSSDDKWSFPDFIIHSPTNIEAYLTTSGQVGRGGDIERWDWDGSSWSKVSTVLTESVSGESLNAPMVPLNFSSGFNVTFCQINLNNYSVANLKLYGYNGTDLINRSSTSALIGWTGDINSFIVDNAYARKGTHSLKSKITSEWHYLYKELPFSMTKSVLEFSINTGATNETGEVCNVLQTDSSTNPGTAISQNNVDASPPNFAYKSGGSWYTIQSYSTNTWYDISIVVDTDTDKFYHLKIDGTEKVNDKALESPITAATRIGIGGRDFGNHWIDIIRVRKYNDPEPTALLGTEQSTGGGANASVTVSDGEITFGNLQLSTTKNTVTSGDTQVINTTGASGNQEIEIKLSSSTVTGTTNSTVLTFVSGSPGQNQLLCQFKGGDVSSYTALTTAYYEFDNSMANNTNANLDIQLTMPSSVSNNNYYDNYQFEITVRATLL